VYGSDGALELPDPNAFGGRLRLRRGRGDWEDVAYLSRGGLDSRGLGLAEMVEAIAAGRPHRASGHLGRHIVGVARAILRASADGVTIGVARSVEQPAPLPLTADARAA